MLLTFSIKKPQDISEAVPQSTSQHLDILAGLYVLLSTGHHETEAKGLRYYGTRDMMSQTQDFQMAYMEEDDKSHQVMFIASNPPATSHYIGPKDVIRKDTVCELLGGYTILPSLIGLESYGRIRYLSVKDVRRWNYLAKLLRRSDMQEAANRLLSVRPTPHDASDQSALGVNIGKLLWSINPQILDSLVSSQKNFTFISDGLQRKGGIEFVLSWHRDSLLLLILITLPIAYGGIHLAAWHFKFTSSIESLLWKVACIDIMATYLAIRAVETTRNFSKSSIWSVRGYSIAVFFALIMYGFNLLFFLSRIYLLVESFISLRHVPIGVYAALPWVQNIPHI